MPCSHLTALYKLCEENQLRLSASDLVHIVCDQCGEKEVCPSVLLDEYEQKESTQQEAASEG